MGVSLAGAALFWCARTVARAGRSEALLAGLAAAVVLGAVTGLAQAYGLVDTNLASLSRAPGGTFGNRNFMAHLVAIGLPVLLYLALEARSRRAVRPRRRRRRARRGGAGAVALPRRRGWLPAACERVPGRSRGSGWAGCGATSGSGAACCSSPAWRRRAVLLALVLPNRLNWRSDSPYLESLTGVANYKEGSGRGRLIQYGNTLAMAAHHPLLGVGPGNWPVYYPGYMSPGDPSFDRRRHHPDQSLAQQRLGGDGLRARVPRARCCWRWSAGRSRSAPGRGSAAARATCPR